jgi:hypothetical protein
VERERSVVVTLEEEFSMASPSGLDGCPKGRMFELRQAALHSGRMQAGKICTAALTRTSEVVASMAVSALCDDVDGLDVGSQGRDIHCVH